MREGSGGGPDPAPCQRLFQEPCQAIERHVPIGDPVLNRRAEETFPDSRGTGLTSSRKIT